jgi:acetoin utilization deacetylase AcuC-like enzyme
MNTCGKTGLAYHSDFVNHDTGPGHPERPDRIRRGIQAIQASDYWGELHLIEPTHATVEQIRYAHASDYVDHVRRCCEQEINLDYDTPVVKESFNIARLSTGGLLRAVDAVMAGTVRHAFALVRPPGHHATPSRSMGFCLFNNIAVAARYLQREHSIEKVAIIDWDVHHGNGTQDIFYADPTVFFFSIHQSPLYPGTGAANQTGSGDAVGTTLNTPVPPGSDIGIYVETFEKVLTPALLNFSPDFILVSAGFDAHRLDPLATINLTAEGFATLTSIVVDLAAETAEGRIVSALEGGYSLKGLSESIVAHLGQLVKSM